MCMDFLLTVIRLSGGLYSLSEDLEPQTAVIETESRFNTITRWIATIITLIIVTAALPSHKVVTYNKITQVPQTFPFLHPG